MEASEEPNIRIPTAAYSSVHASTGTQALHILLYSSQTNKVVQKFPSINELEVKMCYPLLVPTHCCSAYRHILEYRLAWRICDEIIRDHEWKTLCLFHERDKDKITVIEPTHRWCVLVDTCPVCEKLFTRPELVQANKRVTELKKSIIPKIKQTYKETREFRNLAMAMARAEASQARQARYEEANVLLDKLRKQQEGYEAELKKVEERIAEAGQPFLDDQIHNAKPQVQNIGRVTLIYCGPIGVQEAKERDHEPLPEWLERDAKNTMPFGMVDNDPQFTKPQSPLQKVDPLKPPSEAEMFAFGLGYISSQGKQETEEGEEPWSAVNPKDA